MTPLAASLIFIIIAIVVSVFRHLIFHTSSINSGDDSNIALTKLHTLTIPQPSDNKLSYNSLYEAYFKPLQKKQPAQPLPYNSYVLKKAILNNQDVYICDQKFAAIFEEKTSCEGPESICKWQTVISVYRLPFLKKEEQKTIQVEGRVLKSGGSSRELHCKRKENSLWDSQYQLNFVVVKRNKESKKGPGWTMNSLIIQDENEMLKNGTFSLKMMKWNLKKVHHYPKIYSFDEKCLSYVTEEEPWLVNYNCGRNWSSFNILTPSVQSVLFSKLNSSQPPFSSTHHVTPLFLHLFKSTITTYSKSDSCTGACPRIQTASSKNFLTFVFQIVNSHYLVGSTVAQVTIAINGKPQGKDNEGLTSYALILNQINPERRINIDCSLDNKEIKLIKGLYAYQLGLGSDDHIVASISRHSLLCICSYNYMENLKIIFFEDLLSNFNPAEIPSQFLVRTSEDLQQSKVEAVVKKEVSPDESQSDDDEQDSWFNLFDINDYYRDSEDDEPDQQPATFEDLSDEPEYLPEDEGEAGKKEKKGKKPKKDEKKRNKKQKSRKGGKNDNSETRHQDKSAKKIVQLTQAFELLGHGKPQETAIKILQFPMPFTLTSDSKFRIISGDIEFPLIYIETSKKYLLTYQPKEPQEESKNQTKRTLYSYKYSQIGTSIKAPENYIRVYTNDSLKIIKKKDEAELDRFLLDIVQQNGDLLNQVKSLMVIDAKYEDKKHVGLKGLRKPFRKQVIVIWGWGIEVYEINWDKKGLRTQISDIEQILNSNEDGIQMLTLLPFIELFATVYCLFQTLISPR